MKKKLLSALLTFAVLLTLVPLPALAADGTTLTIDLEHCGKVAELTKDLVAQETKMEAVSEGGPELPVTTVTVASKAPIPFSKADSSVGRYRDGWWVGIKIEAPEGVKVDGSPANGTEPSDTFVRFRNNNDYTDRYWKHSMDGGSGTASDPYYMTAWNGPSETQLANGKTAYNVAWYFNWDGNDSTGVVIAAENFKKSGATDTPTEMKGVDQIIKFTFELTDEVKLLREDGSPAWPINVTFVTGEGASAVPDQKVGYNGKAKKPQAPSRVGYKFVGWYKDEKRSQPFNFDTPIAAGTTIYAEWKEVPTLKFELSTEPDLLGKKVSDLFVGPVTGEPVVTSTTREDDGSIKVIVSGVAWDVTGYTQFNEADPSEQEGHYLPIKISSIGGSDKYDVTVTGTKKKEFKDWTSDTLIMRLDGITDKKFTVAASDGTESTTYIVDFSGVEFGSMVTVTFHIADDQENSQTQTLVSGRTVSEPSVTKEGYTLEGWYTSEEFTEESKWNFDDPVTDNMTLYAKWNKNEQEYKVKFDSQGGSAVAEQTVPEGGKVEKPADPEKKDFKFGGWFKEEACTTAWNFDTDTVTEDTTLFAKWEPENSGNTPDTPDPGKKEYKITFNANGGTVTTTTADTKDGKLSTLPTPTRSGYTFNGWYTAASGGTKVDTNTVFDKDTTLYAQWTQNSTTSEYRVWVRSAPHGDISVSTRYAERGERVTVTFEPDTNYRLDRDSVEVWRDDNGDLLTLTRDGDRYTFTMPASDVNVEASFVRQTAYTTVYQTIDPAPSIFMPTFQPSLPTQRAAMAFSDVPRDSWAYPAAQWAYQNGYLDADADGSFQLDGTVSHRRMWEVMAQWLGEPSMDEGEITSWALQHGAARGDVPDSAMTRNDMLVYLYKCYFLMGGDTSSAGNLASYTDNRLIVGTAARNAWTWAVDRGIVTGTADGYLNPAGAVSRGEFAAILMRLCQK